MSCLGAGPGHGVPADYGFYAYAVENVALVAAAVLDLPSTAGRTMEFRDGNLPMEPAG